MDQQQEAESANNFESSPGLRVLYPVHSADNSFSPFIHALKMALASRGELEIVDVRAEEEAIEHIGVRPVLEKWGVLQGGSHRSDLEGIGLKVKKIVREGNKKKEILRRLQKYPRDLLVLGTNNIQESHSAVIRSLPEYLADFFHQSTLFVPAEGQGFVDEQTGALELKSIVLPIADELCYSAAMNALKEFLAHFPGTKPHVVGLHSGTQFPVVAEEPKAHVSWIETLRSEPVVESILNAAEIYNANLIIMTTRGRSRLIQKFTGSFTEQVARSAACPVLSVSI